MTDAPQVTGGAEGSGARADSAGAYGAFLGVTALGYVGLLVFVIAFGLYGEQLTAGVDVACAEAAYQSGKKMESRGNYELAVQRYRQALEGRFREQDREYECMRSIGEVLYRLGRYEEAIDAYGGLPEQAFTVPGHWTAYVSALYYAGDNTEAERLGAVWLAKAEQMKDLQQQVWAHGTLGRVLDDAGRPKRALGHFGAASALEPESQASILAARMLHRLGRTDEAIEQLDAFLRLVDSGTLHNDAKRLRAQYDE